MNGRGRIRRTPVPKPTQELFLIQGDLPRSDAFTIAQLAVMRMFDDTLPPLTVKAQLGNVQVSHVERTAHAPERTRLVHAKPLQACFTSAQVPEAAIDTTSFPYGSISALGSLIMDAASQDWDESVAEMSFTDFSQGLQDVELHAKMQTNGLFVFRSYLEVVKAD